MLSHLNRHVLALEELTHKLSQLDNDLLEQVCQVRYKILKKRLLNTLYRESCVVIMNKSDHQNKMQQMINDGIHDGIYKVTVDNTLDDLKTFKSFLYRNFYGKYEHYEKMLPKSNQPGQLYGTAKTNKFNSI